MNRKISLEGPWRFTLDPEKIGLRENYSTGVFGGTMNLPGSVSEERLSSESIVKLADTLTDPYKYEGYVWLGRKVTIEKLFENIPEPTVFLHLERTRKSSVFVNGDSYGSRDSLCTPHVYDLTEAFSRGRTENGDASCDICLLLDNTDYPVPGGHMTSPDSQTNWIGVTGGIYLMVRNRVFMSQIVVSPDPKSGRVHVSANIKGRRQNGDRLTLTVCAESSDGMNFPKRRYDLPDGNTLDITYDIGINYRLWDENNNSSYTLKLTLTDENGTPDVYFKPFGFRDLTAKDGRFYSKDTEIFLRGRCDAMIFPDTGYTPCDVSSWTKRLRIMKKYGLNLIRFTACCPPEAAFYAADILGMYLCPELPLSNPLLPSAVPSASPSPNPSAPAKRIKKKGEGLSEHGKWLAGEGERILRTYGSHPSFAFFSLGEELDASPEFYSILTERFRAIRPDILYSTGANNIKYTNSINANDDYLVAARLSKDTPLRGSFPASEPAFGFIQTTKPCADYVYDISGGIKADEQSDTANVSGTAGVIKTEESIGQTQSPVTIPVIAHEIGQYAMFPRVSLLSGKNKTEFRYIQEDGKELVCDSTLIPYNFAADRDRLDEAGLLPMAERFFWDSGRFACAQYKREIEANLRSTALSGFHLLELCDYTGGGGAYIGILDVFCNNKGLINEREWRQFCAPFCVIAIFPKYVFISEEYLTVSVMTVNFTGKPIPGDEVTLRFYDKGIEVAVYTEKLRGSVPVGRAIAAHFELKIPFTAAPRKLTMSVTAPGVSNDYKIWCYPDTAAGLGETGEVTVTSDPSQALLLLERGGKVLFFPEHTQRDFMIPGQYVSDFWNYDRVKSACENAGLPIPVGTLGLSIENNHKALSLFPCETYSTPQWFDIVTGSSSLILDGSDIEPIVSVIDNPTRNHKLGLIFEASVGSGKLMVCMSNIARLKSNVPAMQLTKSLLAYMNSPEFNPESELPPAKMRLLFTA